MAPGLGTSNAQTRQPADDLPGWDDQAKPDSNSDSNVVVQRTDPAPCHDQES
jgi:hypothetical protein